ncbi:UDP-2,3-diacylglucosamine diphosphatase [Legionella jordanis]|uniref:UDP-2,3-diacylglucosamine hydrolase n=1 Tax=Legionella jordanis TaxID=456 RepID=A0A0W0VAP0_9GAMM|nr:UDP-2,3-diacylglucosamine diphosphatase [Legionella jordanis]KTD17170.1 UDP-2,3-diacylglucosamine hydrolase [Legionella jordanis]RMX03292.1 UDP-2,3-diacylglucosamine diphosphatase [Legionella jordanis]RMX18270.1 UDP-2,3-diacylglucosamine diphosphatase [Legionella jordanis]VEH12632.1 UDP-2,3-diacylglucosamine hydrolase [Legionella jordanis]HAT8713294.1 UDP-2,3-diacylglucosamine diphosphatase [Legionella jordanis]
MLEAVFISDLHLHPKDEAITARFISFIDWASTNTKSLYILGDFFHAWAGDDDMDEWSKTIAQGLNSLSQKAVKIYYIHGNRDFLLGQCFAELAGITILPEPSMFQCSEPVMLVHGDRYCSNDKGHCWLRKITRNPIFPKIFLSLPLRFRKQIVNTMRMRSKGNSPKGLEQMDVVTETMLQHLKDCNAKIVIHGHIHKPGLRNHEYNNSNYSQYVLSDWDNRPEILGYDKTLGFRFIQPV